jgi:hypothetical protein
MIMMVRMMVRMWTHSKKTLRLSIEVVREVPAMRMKQQKLVSGIASPYCIKPHSLFTNIQFL